MGSFKSGYTLANAPMDVETDQLLFLKHTRHFLAGFDLVSMTKDSAGPKSRSVVIPVNVEQDDQDSV